MNHRKTRKNINTPTNASVMLNKADIVDRKYECNEKGRGLTQKEQRMQGEKLITKPSPIRVKCRFPKNVKTKKYVILLL